MKYSKTKISLITLTQSLLITLLCAFLTTTAFASPLNKGASWSAHLGYETDLGSARDPGDRDGAMAGSASGPSIGLQWWHQDWLALESSFIFQSSASKAVGEYEQTAWRLGTSIRIAYPAMFSPHFSVGLAYDNFESKWSVPSEADRSYGSGVDQLNGLVGTTELGLSVNYSGWALSAHLGYLAYIGQQKDSQIDTWTEGATGSKTSDDQSAWAKDNNRLGNINLGLRLTYSF